MCSWVISVTWRSAFVFFVGENYGLRVWGLAGRGVQPLNRSGKGVFFGRVIQVFCTVSLDFLWILGLRMGLGWNTPTGACVAGSKMRPA